MDQSPRAYVVCKQDKLLPEEFQRWMIESSGVSESDRDWWHRSYANVFKATRTLQCF
ncbi:Alpha/Beta hydrolase fold containing protein, partial [Trema orientale]